MLETLFISQAIYLANSGTICDGQLDSNKQVTDARRKRRSSIVAIDAFTELLIPVDSHPDNSNCTVVHIPIRYMTYME